VRFWVFIGKIPGVEMAPEAECHLIGRPPFLPEMNLCTDFRLLNKDNNMVITGFITASA